MTTATQSNAIFKSSIIFHIIDVMDFFTVFTTNCTCIIVAFSNRFFELAIKLSGIILTPPAPHMTILPHTVFGIASMRTVFSRILPFVYKNLSTTLTCFWFISTSPKTGKNTNSNILFTSTGGRTKMRFVFPRLYNFKNLAAIFTNLINSIFGLWDGFGTAGIRTIFRNIDLIRENEIYFIAKLTSFLYSYTAFFGSIHFIILKRSRPNRAVYLSRVSHNLRRAVSNELNKSVAITLDKGDYTI